MENQDTALCVRCGVNPRPLRRNWESVNSHVAASGRYRLEVSSYHHLCDDCHQEQRYWDEKLKSEGL